MTTPFDEDPLEHFDAERERHRENRGRLAGVYAVFNTEGMGMVEFEKRIDFGVIYTQKPMVSVGHEIDTDAVRDLVGDEPTHWPQSTGYVTDWDQDEKGNYIGAWVAVSVWWQHDPLAGGGVSLFAADDVVTLIPVDAAVPITHHFTFQAVALKKVPAAVGD